ncbi:MAG: hypothetical protein JNM39_11440 [Bdellovibrionaceae bacterium]|nr:hypothetical protein [Pseudobdellovibrionaceae bacterium]
MTIQLMRFGNILTSRPEGREAALILIANELRNTTDDIYLDFSGVFVMTPSWLGEFVDTLEAKNKKVFFMKSQNLSVIGSIQTLDEMAGKGG